MDDKLAVLGVHKWTVPQPAVTGIQWFGESTLMVTTRRHLLFIYCDRHPKVSVVLSLTDCLAKNSQQATAIEETDVPVVPVLVKALADRVIIASQSLDG